MHLQLEHKVLPGSLELAYLGDTIYDLYVRTHLIELGGKVGALHRQAIQLVCAHAQAEALSRVEPMLSEEELAVVRRARNVRQTPPRNADIAEYHKATVFEALLGYLYATDRDERLNAVLGVALPRELLAQVHAKLMGGRHGE